jgi:signal transduction histidine kinase
MDNLARMFAGQPHLTFRVFDSRMALLVSSRQPPPDRPPWIALPGMRDASRGIVATGIIPDEQPGGEKLYVVQPVDRNARRVGYLRISMLLRDFQRTFARVQMAVGLGLLGTLIGCTAISLMLARSLSDPIRQMSHFASRVGAGRWSERLNLTADGEIGDLAASLNQMCERLEKQDEERRAFLAAVTHELRTPAANIQVTLEALQAGADYDPALRERFVKASLGEAERLSQLIRDLMDLARLEAESAPMRMKPVDMSALIRRATGALEPRLRESDLTIEIEGGSDVWVLGDVNRLLQMLMNLLDNAVRFSRPQCCIRVAVVARTREAVLTVEDAGPGIPPEDLTRIFDRFYTADKSRARGTGGTGLGLAIVREIVALHHGEVEAANVPEGTRFTVRLPRAVHAAGARS